MAHNFAINEDVHHQPQGPQGRTGTREQNVYTIITRMPIFLRSTKVGSAAQ